MVVLERLKSSTFARKTTKFNEKMKLPKQSESPIFSCQNPRTIRESLKPLSLVAVMFVVRGFIHGFSFSLTKEFQDVLGISKLAASGMQVAQAVAYLIGAPVLGTFVLRRHGYRWTYIISLTITACGAIIFWPAGVKRSFGLFCFAQFFMCLGTSGVEMGAIAYLAICGPPKWSELRVNCATTLSAIAYTGSVVLSSFIVFGRAVSKEQSLKNVQWLYLGDFVATLSLALMFYLVPIPEISDAEMAAQAQASSELTGWKDRPFRKQTHMWWGVGCVGCDAGAAASIGAYFINYCIDQDHTMTNRDATHRYAIGLGLLILSRLLFTFLMSYESFKPRYLLLFLATMTVIVQSVSIAPLGQVAIAFLMTQAFWRSSIIPTTFALSLRGLGRHHRKGMGFLTASDGAAAAVFAPVTGAIADRYGTRVAMCVPLVGIALGWTYPVFLNLTRGKMLDGFRQCEHVPEAVNEDTPVMTRENSLPETPLTPESTSTAKSCETKVSEKEISSP